MRPSRRERLSMRTSSRNRRFSRDASIMRVPRVAPRPGSVNDACRCGGRDVSCAAVAEEPILIAGAGALGSVVGGLLARAGHSVTLLGRAPHLDAIERDGLVLDGLFGAHRVGGLRGGTDSPALERRFSA